MAYDADSKTPADSIHNVGTVLRQLEDKDVLSPMYAEPSVLSNVGVSNIPKRQ